MALTPTQIANFLFKKLLGKGSTNDSRQYFEEPYTGRSSILLSQIWADSDQIPTHVPTLSADQTIGVVQRKVNVTLTAVAGTSNSFFSSQLVDAIPFNFGDGSYNYAVTDASGNPIPLGQNDWIVDGDAGVLTFYTGTPTNMPPKISFYKYVGVKAGVSGFVKRSGDQMTGRLAFAATTVPATSAILIDFDEDNYQTIQITTPYISFATKNRGAGKTVCLRLINTSGSPCLFDFDLNIKFLNGSNPASLDDGVFAILTLTSFGLNEDDTVAVYAAGFL